MFSSGPHAIMETATPLVCGIINNALLHSSPTINQTLPQILHLSNKLAAALCPRLYNQLTTGLRSGLLGGQKSVEMNAGVSCSRG